MESSTTNLIPKKRGRPKTGVGKQLQVRLDPATLSALDAFITEQPKKLKRPEAVRRILKDFLIGHGVLVPES